MPRRRAPVFALGAICVLAMAWGSSRRGTVRGWLEAKRDVSGAAPSVYVIGVRDARGPIADPDGLSYRWLACGADAVEEDRIQRASVIQRSWAEAPTAREGLVAPRAEAPLSPRAYRAIAAAIAPPPYHRPRDSPAGPTTRIARQCLATVPPHRHDPRPGRLPGPERAEELPLVDPMANDAERAACRARRSLAARASRRPRLHARRHPITPGLDS